ncbi:MAG: hypothetical protein K2Y01_07090 [Rhabdochlamydiaceae bacterium]|nr:hypothetical protein [Rhabdochlamydiaceae bacterium]
MKKNLHNAIAVIAIFLQSSLFAIADISLIVVDIKYNQQQGVKICEMQPGSFSRFSGANSPDEPNAVPLLYCNLLEQYNTPIYFTHPLYHKMKEAFIQHSWSSTHSIETLLTKVKKTKDNDPDNLFDYQCFLFSLQTEPIFNRYQELFPHILFLDRAILPFSQSKYVMNSFFDSIEETKKLRPQWGLYRKGTSAELVEAIAQDIPGNIVVIKPLQSTMGRGVIILEKQDLQKTLDYIFLSEKEVLLKDLERSYSHYAVDESDYFIVEEFIESDPLFLGKDQLPYDCTMRIIAVLSYHHHVADITLLKEYWYSPNKPIDTAYTLIQSHKAKGTYFTQVAPEVIEKVKQELFPALLKAYKKMLDQGS